MLKAFDLQVGHYYGGLGSLARRAEGRPSREPDASRSGGSPHRLSTASLYLARAVGEASAAASGAAAATAAAAAAAGGGAGELRLSIAELALALTLTLSPSPSPSPNPDPDPDPNQVRVHVQSGAAGGAAAASAAPALAATAVAAASGGPSPSPSSQASASSYEYWQTLARAIEEGAEEEDGGDPFRGQGEGREGGGPLSEARRAEVVAVLRDGIAHHPKVSQ